MSELKSLTINANIEASKAKYNVEELRARLKDEIKNKGKIIITGGASGAGRTRASFIGEGLGSHMKKMRRIYESEKDQLKQQMRETSEVNFDGCGVLIPRDALPTMSHKEVESAMRQITLDSTMRNPVTLADELKKISMGYKEEPQSKPMTAKKLKRLWNEAKKHGKHPNEIKALQQAYEKKVKEGKYGTT